MAASLTARPTLDLCKLAIIRRAEILGFGSRHASTAPSVASRNSPSSDEVQKIVIPRKKKRDSVSVLKALASTVELDPQSPAYKYTDDPFLIPTSNLSKKSYALAKESGRKAARYILENYSEWFNENVSEPKIKSYMPQENVYQHTLPNEAALKERIEKRRVKDAIDVYNKVKIEGTQVSEEICHQFLELLCVYNSQDAPQNMMPEEFYFRKDFGHDSQRPAKTWKKDGMAERVYDDIKEKNSQDHQNLIKGMARYLETEGAFDLYHQMLDNKTPVDVGTYNELIRASTFHHDNYESKWKQVETLLEDMSARGVPPTPATFHQVLSSLQRIRNYRSCPALVLQTLNEMKGLGFEPTLADWAMVLRVFYRQDHAQSNMLLQIVQHLEEKPLSVQSFEDGDFFTNAMKFCNLNLHDVELAHRIHRLATAHHNAALLADARLEVVYYNNYLTLLCNFQPLEEIMEVYQQVTPHLYTPSLLVMEALLKAVDQQDGFHWLPLLWTDLTLYDYQRRPHLLEYLLQLMASKKQQEELQSQYNHVATQLLEQWKSDLEESQSRRFSYAAPNSLSTGNMIGYLLIIANNSDNPDLAWDVFRAYRDNRHLFSGPPGEAGMLAAVKGCVGRGEAQKALEVVQLMSALEMSGTRQAAKLILDSQELELAASVREGLAVLF